MVHNGIEYRMLQGYGEGFEILKSFDFGEVDLRAISHRWNRGSAVRSWLLELAERAFEKGPDLASSRGYVEDSGERRWTVLEAIEKDVPAPVLTLSLLMRLRSPGRECRREGDCRLGSRVRRTCGEARRMRSAARCECRQNDEGQIIVNDALAAMTPQGNGLRKEHG